VNLNGTINGGTVTVAGGTLWVRGYLTGGTATTTGGTIVRMSTCNITSTLSGTIRYETQLALENLDPASTETITAITYRGISDADDSAFVQLPAGGTIYPLYGETITKVTTDAGNVFRLGTRNTSTLVARVCNLL
jgi:hypothetical protein